ncbi:MAG: hypothetical protein K9M51_01950 [Candidatus Gracilibacteria bacterium]|nr:hypothetical protein [Candidatus Gracilibacteria bacterium]
MAKTKIYSKNGTFFQDEECTQVVRKEGTGSCYFRFPNGIIKEEDEVDIFYIIFLKGGVPHLDEECTISGSANVGGFYKFENGVEIDRDKAIIVNLDEKIILCKYKGEYYHRNSEKEVSRLPFDPTNKRVLIGGQWEPLDIFDIKKVGKNPEKNPEVFDALFVPEKTADKITIKIRWGYILPLITCLLAAAVGWFLWTAELNENIATERTIAALNDTIDEQGSTINELESQVASLQSLDWQKLGGAEYANSFRSSDFTKDAIKNSLIVSREKGGTWYFFVEEEGEMVTTKITDITLWPSRSLIVVDRKVGDCVARGVFPLPQTNADGVWMVSCDK